MARWFTDFSEYIAGVQPSDWTLRWGSNGSATVRSSGIPPQLDGPHALRLSITSSGATMVLSWDAVGMPSGDVQILAKMLFEGSSGSDRTSRLVLHGSGATYSSRSSYETQIFHNNSSTQNQLLISVNNGSASALSSPQFALSTNEAYWLRFDRSGATIRYKFWRDGDAEPGSWTASAASSFHSSGWVAVSTHKPGIPNPIVWFDQVGVGTNGDDAPSEPLQPDPPTGLTLNATGPNSISVTWNEPD